MRIKKEDTVAVIVDFQERLFPYIHEHEKLTKNVIRLIHGLKALEIPMIVTQQYTKGLGETNKEIANAIGNYQHIEKGSFSCCGSEEFCASLKNTGKKNIIVTGIESHVCVLQTVIDLLDMGYKPVLIEDCVSSRNPEDKRIAIERMRSEGAIISSYESILFELTVVSGTDTFKAISKIVK